MERWPALDRPEWEATCDHLRLWAQMLGKTKLALVPSLNHWWHTTLLVSPHGLTTGIMMAPGGLAFDLELDLLSHQLVARTSEGDAETLPLGRGPVADFFARYVELLGSLGVQPHLYKRPVENPEAIPFDEDWQERPYDPEWAQAFFGALLDADRLLKIFRGAFIGKASPVHFFWGGMDLATTRFSGRRAPPYPGGIPNCPNYVMLEAYSHEVSSAGFWPGGMGYPNAAFYSYAYPAPSGYADAPVLPDGAFYSQEAREFLLPYEAVRASDDPDLTVLSFLQSTYIAAAETGRWNRAVLERDFGEGEPLGDESWSTTASTSAPSSAHQPM